MVNFDPSITQIIRETDCMLKMELDIPEPAKIIYQRQDQLKEYQHKLKVKYHLFYHVIEFKASLVSFSWYIAKKSRAA